MFTAPIIRFVTAADANAILEIYKPFITNTPITFELEIPALSEFTERITTIATTFPWLVLYIGGELAGYAYASRYRDRIAYQWSVECSIYVAEAFRGKGIAQALYHALFELLKLQGFANVYAIITSPNQQSEKFHSSFGFTDIGIFKAVGYKLGCWHDVKWMGLRLNNYEAITPQSPVKITAIIADSSVIPQITSQALKYIR